MNNKDDNGFDELADATLPNADENGNIELPSMFGEDETFKTNRNNMKDMISTMLNNQKEWMNKRSKEE